MPTEETQEVFDLLKKYIPEIKQTRAGNTPDIAFTYGEHTYCLNYDPCQSSVIVTVNTASSGRISKTQKSDKYWNFNFAEIGETTSGDISIELKPENAKKLKKYLEKLVEKCKPGNIMQQFSKPNA